MNISQIPSISHDYFFLVGGADGQGVDPCVLTPGLDTLLPIIDKKKLCPLANGVYSSILDFSLPTTKRQ